MRIEHPGLVAVELRPVIRTFCALDIGRRNAAEHVASGFLRAHGGGRAGFVANGGSIPDARVRKGAGLAAKAPRRLRPQRPVEDRIRLLRIRQGRRRRRARTAPEIGRQRGRSVLWRLRCRADVAPRRSPRLGGPRPARRGIIRLTQDARARLDRTDPGRPGLTRRLDELTRRFSLHLADQLLEREALAGDVGLVERRRDSAQLREQGRACPFVERAAVLAIVLFETGDGA